MLTACDPIKDSKDLDYTSLTSSNLLEGAEFSQYADAACTTPQADGNYIKYNIPKASGIYIYYLKNDGSEFKLSSGPSGGVFNFVPARGSDPNQTVYFKFVNAKGEETIATKEFTVQVAAELKEEIKYLASNAYGKKTWTWNVGNTNSGGHVWGNFGADGNWRGENLSDFIWWGVDDAAQLLDQLNHSVSGTATGEEDNDATMVLYEDGTVKCYNGTGSEIRSGSFEIDLSTADGWKLGTFKTTEGATLFPFEINAGGRYVTDFQIWKISDSEMTLTYPDNGAFSGWSEGTYWSFKKK